MITEKIYHSNKALIDKHMTSFAEIFDVCLNAKSEKVLIISDLGEPGYRIASLFACGYATACRKKNISHKVIFQDVKKRGDTADDKVIDALLKLPPQSIVLVVVSNVLGKLGWLGRSFRKYMKSTNHRFLSSTGLGSIPDGKANEVFSALDIDYKKIDQRAKRLKEKLDFASTIKIVTKNGTNVKSDIKGIKAKIASGIYKEKGTGGNIPGTEVYIAPKKTRVEGKAVIDGSSKSREGTMVPDIPLVMHIKEGRVVKMNECEAARRLERSFLWAEEKSRNPKNVRRICEIGIGLNPKAKILGSTIIDEKTLGTAHIAVGSNYWFGGNIHTIIHFDQVMRDVKIYLDDVLLNLKNI